MASHTLSPAPTRRSILAATAAAPLALAPAVATTSPPPVPVDPLIGLIADWRRARDDGDWAAAELDRIERELDAAGLDVGVIVHQKGPSGRTWVAYSEEAIIEATAPEAEVFGRPERRERLIAELRGKREAREAASRIAGVPRLVAEENDAHERYRETWNRIRATRATTIDGAALRVEATIERNEADEDHGFLDDLRAVLADLRALGAGR